MTRASRSPRIRTAIGATLVDSDGGEIQVEIVDLSGSGFKIRCDGSLTAGERVILRVSRQDDHAAQIQWARGFEAGGKFLEPVVSL